MKISTYPLPILNGLIIGFLGGILGLTIFRSAYHWILTILLALLAGALLGSGTQVLFARSRLKSWPPPRQLLVLLFVESLLIVFILVPMMGARDLVYPVRAGVEITPADAGMDAEWIALRTSDGVTISGWYTPPENGAVIIGLHGLGGNRLQVVPLMKELQKRGFGSVMLDLRAQGESGGKTFTPCTSIKDIQAVIQFLDRQPEIKGIGVIGFSSGANTALCAAASIPKLEALWLDGLGLGDTRDALQPVLPEIRPFFFSIPINWMYFRSIQMLGKSNDEPAVKELIAKITPRPIFFVAAGQDWLEPALAKRYSELAGSPANYWVVPDADHCAGFFVDWDGYMSRLVNFFETTLPLKTDG